MDDSAIVIKPKPKKSTGIGPQEALLKDLQIYPNPARDKITVSLNKQALNQVIITVIDMRGLKVGLNKYIMVANNNVDVNISSLKSGVYILQIQTEHDVQSFKFIKY